MPAMWLRVIVRSPSDELAGLLAEGLLACGGLAVEERGADLVTYIASQDDAADDAGLLARVREQVHAVTRTDAIELECERVPEQDWIALWRAGLRPRRVGDRLVISPTWSDIETAPHELVVRIDPQMAFGTGEHASTRGVLRLMQRAVEPGARLLDIGTGSGILAIAAARLGAAHVLAVESDADALPNARENVRCNGVSDTVVLMHGVVAAPFLAAHTAAPFDGILANVLSGELLPLLPSFQHALNAGGWAILAGILVDEADDVRTAVAAAGLHVHADDTEDQWWSVLLRRDTFTAASS